MNGSNKYRQDFPQYNVNQIRANVHSNVNQEITTKRRAQINHLHDTTEFHSVEPKKFNQVTTKKDLSS